VVTDNNLVSHGEKALELFIQPGPLVVPGDHQACRPTFVTKALPHEGGIGPAEQKQHIRGLPTQHFIEGSDMILLCVTIPADKGGQTDVEILRCMKLKGFGLMVIGPSVHVIDDQQINHDAYDTEDGFRFRRKERSG
jgi:hypothetical protein